MCYSENNGQPRKPAANPHAARLVRIDSKAGPALIDPLDVSGLVQGPSVGTCVLLMRGISTPVGIPAAFDDVAMALFGIDPPPPAKPLILGGR